METNQFALHNGKIVFVPDVPEANDFVDQDDVSTRFDQAGYDEAIQSAISKGIEVENQDEVFPVLWKSATGGYRDLDEFRNDKNKLYPLKCMVEVISCIGGCKNFEKSVESILICHDNGCQYKVAHVTFPEQKPEPEASGQEQEAVDHANRILFSNLKCQIGNIFTKKFLEHNDGKFHTALELNPAIHAVTEFVFEKIKQQKP